MNFNTADVEVLVEEVDTLSAERRRQLKHQNIESAEKKKVYSQSPNKPDLGRRAGRLDDEVQVVVRSLWSSAPTAGGGGVGGSTCLSLNKGAKRAAAAFVNHSA